MKIVSIVGARPQFIKCAAVSRELRKVATEVLVHTGQHYDEAMSEVFFRELEIPPPEYHLAVGSGSHAVQTGAMLQRIEEVLVAERPDYVLVYGDTNSTLAGALAAAKLQIPVAHVEAGLRSFNRRMPEEVNRVVTDHLATLHFCPTGQAVANLADEGIRNQVYQVGDVMYDAALRFGELATRNGAVLGRLQLAARQFVLATIHRAENTDDPQRLQVIAASLQAVAEKLPVVFPLHPRTRQALARLGLAASLPSGLHVLDPVSYLDMVQLERLAAVIVTDSGGVQKEAFFHRVPCVTLRFETEWPELVALGWNTLCPPQDAAEVTNQVLAAVGRQGQEGCPYGDGRAAQRIAGMMAGSNATGPLRSAEPEPLAGSSR